jgi:hypothetical protein
MHTLRDRVEGIYVGFCLIVAIVCCALEAVSKIMNWRPLVQFNREPARCAMRSVDHAPAVGLLGF